jgi:UDP-glucose 4-epimerase
MFQEDQMRVLVTGGAGYIGGHTVLALKARGHEVTVLDDLSKGYREPFFGDYFVEASVADSDKVRKTVKERGIEAVLHFAAFIEAGESMQFPGKYFLNNAAGTLSLLESLRLEGVDKLIFSSTAALYGIPDSVPIREDSALKPVNAYGESKLLVEQALRWYSEIHDFRYVSLRYFNAAGADEHLRCGERHRPETHLIPLALQAAYGERPRLSLFGTDYRTKDGTCVRDYIHVSDLADAHVLALDYLASGGKSQRFNLGNGQGFSNREVIQIVKSVTGKDFPVIETDRRPGDPETLVASSERIRTELGWKPRFADLKGIVNSADAFYKKWKGLA